MKKKAKISLIVTSSVVGAILIAVIILCCITVKPLNAFMDYDSVYITNSEGTLPSGTISGKYKDKLDEALEDTSFSVMHAMLEFVGSYGPEFVMTKDEDDNEVKSALTVDEAREACKATEDSYMMEFVFDCDPDYMREYKVDGESVKYDRMIMNVKNSGGEVHWVRIYLYRSDYDSKNPETSSYRVNPVRVRMDTTDLFIALGEMVKAI